MRIDAGDGADSSSSSNNPRRSKRQREEEEEDQGMAGEDPGMHMTRMM